MSDVLKRVAPIGEERDREILKDAATYAYAERPEGAVQAHVYFPEEGRESAEPRPAVVFFHGGFWDTPTPTQFVPHCLHFASRGAVTITAETRSEKVHGTGAREAIDDARDLIRWVRDNAGDLGVDPSRVVAGGAAGGALLALLTTLPKDKKLDIPNSTDCRAQALILFSSLVNPLSVPKALGRFRDYKQARSLSPLRRVRRKLPPMIAFHGKSDRITPFADVEKFRRKLRFWRNRFDLIDFERADHSFFNFNVSHDRFEATIGAADRFLVDIGLLQEDPDLDFH
ncbi:MAG: alpha/beta hydrolase [Akkermansiaceae bacterium]|nr:alpha/beta hydrolase [Akkermansiaceae bacterium]